MTLYNATLFDDDSAIYPVRYLVSDLCQELESYLEPAQIKEVYEAYLFAAEAHEGQSRQTGEPYIFHPLAVARILSTLNMDHKGLIAGILHDVIEDTPTAKDNLSEIFGQDVAELVDGVSKLSHLDFNSKVEAKAASFQKMILAMTKDIRVILIKLADRLHNMRTLGVMRPAKQRRIARETLEIYTPIAYRLGMNAIRIELEDLCFHAYWPMRYRVLKHRCYQMIQTRLSMIDSTRQFFIAGLHEKGIASEVAGRQKHLYSLYKKMRDKHLSFQEVVDKFAFRIVVDNIDDCYRTLGVVHNLYRPIPGKFKDYIAIPKINGYQSLHTVLVSPDGLRIELQIRSKKMEGALESGIAAHWMYKSIEDVSDAQANTANWLKNLLELQQDAGNSMEFMEHVKIDLFPERVYVFTPLGEIKTLRKGATVIDFAYAVHSDIGNHCISARVDKVFVPLKTRLYSGQTIDIDIKDNAKPQPSWLNFAVTPKARTQIRHYLNKMRDRDLVILGLNLLMRELTKYNKQLMDITDQAMQKLLDDHHLEDQDALLNLIGTGEIPAFIVAKRLVGNDLPLDALEVMPKSNAPLTIRGTEGMAVSFARCCRPIPDDKIVSVFSMGKGIVIHRDQCRNIGDTSHNQASIPVVWVDDVEGDFITNLNVEAYNKPGVLANVAAVIAAQNCNLESIETKIKDEFISVLHFALVVENRKNLAEIMRALHALPHVLSVLRANL